MSMFRALCLLVGLSLSISAAGIEVVYDTTNQPITDWGYLDSGSSAWEIFNPHLNNQLVSVEFRLERVPPVDNQPQVAPGVGYFQVEMYQYLNLPPVWSQQLPLADMPETGAFTLSFSTTNTITPEVNLFWLFTSSNPIRLLATDSGVYGKVAVTHAPEPGTWMLGALACGTLTLARRYRNAT